MESCEECIRGVERTIELKIEYTVKNLLKGERQDSIEDIEMLKTVVKDLGKFMTAINETQLTHATDLDQLRNNLRVAVQTMKEERTTAAEKLVRKAEADMKQRFLQFLKDFGDREDNIEQTLSQIPQLEGKIEDVQKKMSS